MAKHIVAKTKGTIALAGGRAFFVPAGFTTRGNIMSKFEVPEVLSRGPIQDKKYEALYGAVLKHQKHLSKAEYDLDVARDLAATLQGFLTNDEYDENIDDCYTASTVVELIEKRILKARERLDMHGRRHSNLFVAYFDLKAAGAAK